MPTLMLVIGGNGAGKSTWCSANRERLPDHFYDADSIARGLGGWNDVDRQRDARRLVDVSVQGHLEKNESFGFESTYSGRSRPSIVETAAARGYEVHAIFVGTTRPGINVERVRKRVVAATGHDVPVHEIKRRWTAAQENPVATAGCMTTIELLDNSKRIREVGLMAGNKAATLTEAVPEWARSLMTRIAEAIRNGAISAAAKDVRR